MAIGGGSGGISFSISKIFIRLMYCKIYIFLYQCFFVFFLLISFLAGGIGT